MSRRNHHREIQVPLSRIEDRRGGLLLHGSRSHHPHSLILEDRIAIQHREIQSLLGDNQQLASAHVALKHDLSAAQHDLRVLSVTASDIKAERDAEIRDVYERSLKLDAEARAVDAMTSELARVQADLHQFGSARQDLTAQLQALEDDLARVREDSQEVPEIKAEIEIMRKEIQRGRAAIEYEKKTRVSNLEQRKVMERSMISMANEIEKLHAELANAEKRARAAVAAATAANPSPGYTTSYGNPDMAYGGNSYPDPYGINKVQGAANAGPQFVSGAILNGPYDTQQTHVHR
ncbi:protein FLC EXPRESSOR isoform X1 [Quercus robur]|uniref:Protein FLC EXPRESSOR n=1 Tax=Quercus lobata TaxID=97700 RepID=A0A7N2QXX0_QUELO|nr:protein FLC EXPRESSOR [Quercus lobata]XP_050240581.1 protein FLC EXPRESSOR isoform X1 [Quercus robur]